MLNMKKQIIITLVWIVLTASQAFSQNYYDLYFTVSRTSYHGLLWLDSDGSGIMRVKYWDGCSNVMIEEDMETGSIEGIPAIIGSDPVYAGTNILHSTYAPDVLFFSTNNYGTLKMYVTDAYGNLATVSLELVSGSKCTRIKRQFGWR